MTSGEEEIGDPLQQKEKNELKFVYGLFLGV
jgi:hypothetical protein